ncbi:MAG: tetratricopeptide repeat protein, partial [Thermoanaerobaculia bacterium]
MKKILNPAARLLSILIVASPGFASWEQGVSAFQAGRFEVAVDEFQSLVNSNPVAPQGHYMLGLSLLQMRQATASLEPLAKAVELEPSNTIYHLALAQTQLEVRRPDDALTTLAAQDPAAVPDAQRSGFGRLLAEAATESGDGEKSLAALERALTVDPSSKSMWQASAQIAHQLNRPRRAFDAFATAYTLDPTDVELGRHIVQTAFAAARAHQDDDRRGWFQRASRVAVELAGAAPTAEHLLLAGEALLGAQDYDGARSWFEKAAAADPADPWPRFYLGRCASEEPETALSHLQATLERSPDEDLTGQIQNARGAALRRLERFEEAEEAYRLAGNEEKVAKMERLIEIKQGNDQWAAEKRRCEEKQRAAQDLLKENESLSGTAVWRELEKDVEAGLAD